MLTTMQVIAKFRALAQQMTYKADEIESTHGELADEDLACILTWSAAASAIERVCDELEGK